MARALINQEIKGGKSPRQRVWDAIRKSPERFTQVQIIKASNVSDDIVKDYVKALLKADFIAVVDAEPVGALCKRHVYQLLKNTGIEAPRIRRNGELVKSGSINEAMWGTLRRVLKGQLFNFRELASFASTASQSVSEETAKTYVQMLASAGYLECMVEAKAGRRAQPGRYRFRPEMDTGPRAPMIQRTKQVYDPNKNRVMYVQQIGDQDEIL